MFSTRAVLYMSAYYLIFQQDQFFHFYFNEFFFTLQNAYSSLGWQRDMMMLKYQSKQQMFVPLLSLSAPHLREKPVVIPVV